MNVNNNLEKKKEMIWLCYGFRNYLFSYAGYKKRDEIDWPKSQTEIQNQGVTNTEMSQVIYLVIGWSNILIL